LTYRSFYKQRKRWSRGLIEAFRSSHSLLFSGKRYSFFIWYNFFFPLIDLSYLSVFVPGVVLSMAFGINLLAGVMTLYLIPILILYSALIYRIQARHMREIGEEIKGDWIGLMIYALFYQLMMNPATVHGYFSEMIKAKRIWR
jgi:biofilm PGA synthesis N-glycosyltransferase PgaC